MGTILALAMLAQAPESATGDIQRALAFTRAVEEFAGATPPAPYADLFRRMGSPSWRERERASAGAMSATAARPEDVRWLFAGRRSRDPEVALRCNTLIRRLHPCPSCGGAGESRVWPGWECYDCRGTRTAWPLSPWD